MVSKPLISQSFLSVSQSAPFLALPFPSLPVSLTILHRRLVPSVTCPVLCPHLSSASCPPSFQPSALFYVHALSITQIPPAMGGFNPNPSMFSQMPGGYPSPSPGGFGTPPPNQQPCGLYPQPGPGMPQGPGMGYPGGAPPGQPMPGYPGAPGMNPSMPAYPKVPSPNPSMPGFGGGAPVAPAINVRA